MAETAEEICREVLTSNLNPQFYLNISEERYQAVQLSFEKGIIEWSMFSSDWSELTPRSLDTEAPCIFLDFSRMHSFITDINHICNEYIYNLSVLGKVQMVRDVVNSHFLWFRFLIPTDEDLDVSNSMGRNRMSYDEYKRVQGRIHPLAKIESFTGYLKSQLSLGSKLKEIAAIADRTNRFLSNCGLTNGQISLLNITDEQLRKRLVEFDERYKAVWRAKLQSNYQKPDMDEFKKSGVYAAIKLGERCSIPYAAAHKFLSQKKLESDPKYMEEQMRLSRLNRFK